MSEIINVTILHPTTGSSLEVELSNELSVEKIIDELIACNFINIGRFSMYIKNSKKEISGKQTLVSGGVVDGSVLRVIPQGEPG